MYQCDSSERLICSIGGFRHPTGVSVSLNGSVWVVDTDNDRIVKYNYYRIFYCKVLQYLMI